MGLLVSRSNKGKKFKSLESLLKFINSGLSPSSTLLSPADERKILRVLGRD